MVAITDGDAAATADVYKHDRRCIIYPSYINSACTVQEGRVGCVCKANQN
jgi:hypothetical protein